MKNIHASRSRLAAFLLPLALMATAPAGHAADAARPPVADYFRNPRMDGISVSPDGLRAAMVMFSETGRGQLAVFDLAKPSGGKIIAGFEALDVSNIRWVNDKRLVFSARDSDRTKFYGMNPGLWAINADGSDFRHLIYVDYNEAGTTSSRIKSRVLSTDWQFDELIRDGSDDVVVARALYDNRDEFTGTHIARLNTSNGLLTELVSKPPEHAQAWWTDGMGVPVAAISQYKEKAALHLRQPDGSWKKSFESDAWLASPPVPLAVDRDNQLWMVASDPDRKSDAAVLVRYKFDDPQARPKALISLKGYDFDGSLAIDRATREVLGVRFETDGPGVHWFNTRMRAMQADIDAQLPSTANTLLCSRCLDASALLVTARSDRQPALLFSYEPATRKLSLLMTSKPWLQPQQLGEREFVMVKARDGLSIPTLVTHPPGPRQAKRPAVMLVHGGPWVRGAHWAQGMSEAQFLASRGYVVIEPEFRGSTGYGAGHFKAGFKQWGLAMQDDVSDAMDFAAAQGWVDPARVCIAGASYGGYATLMGLAKEPERYRCGIQWVGVTDINLMYKIQWSDASDNFKQYGMPRLIGDPVKDAEQLQATSPITQAGRINKPLLMAYGGVDRRVPIAHGEAMHKALKSAGRTTVDWVVYPDEGHGWSRMETQVDFWTRVEKFLDRNIGAGAPTR